MNKNLEYLQPEIVSKLANMELRARLVVEGFLTGLHKSPYHGFSVEFAEYRQYLPGDEIRKMDWKAYARTNKLYIKKYEEETNLISNLVIDVSASMGYSSNKITKLNYASYLAASLSYLSIGQRDAVGLTLFDENIRTKIEPHSTKTHLKRILLELQNIIPSKKTNTSNALNILAEQSRRRGLIILFSDLFDEPSEVMRALKHFRYDKHEVILFHILDPLEKSFAHKDDAIFRDLETSEEIRTQPYQLQKSYQNAMKDFIEYYKRMSLTKIDYVLVDTNTPFDITLTRYLIKREQMK